MRLTERPVQMPEVSERVDANAQQVNHHTDLPDAVTLKLRMMQMKTRMTTPREGELVATPRHRRTWESLEDTPRGRLW